jgi:predicted nucleic acid-binding protein
VTPILVDTNVLVDVIRFDPVWTQWSSEALSRAHEAAVVVVNPVVYGELAAGFDSIEALDDALPGDLYRREALPYSAAFLAGRCFAAYRRRGGTRTGVLPDFFIGAHAAVAGYRLLTRDPRSYRTYFPSLELITPVMPA